jgi:hypothetical protein
MTSLEKICLWISILLINPLLSRIRMFFMGKIRAREFFETRVFFSAKVEVFLAVLGVMFFLIFFFLGWYTIPELR